MPDAAADRRGELRSRPAINARLAQRRSTQTPPLLVDEPLTAHAPSSRAESGLTGSSHLRPDESDESVRRSWTMQRRSSVMSGVSGIGSGRGTGRSLVLTRSLSLQLQKGMWNLYSISFPQYTYNRQTGRSVAHWIQGR